MKRLDVLAALLTWGAVACAVLIGTMPDGAAANGVTTIGVVPVRTLFEVTALAVAVTLGLILLSVPSVLGYIVVHVVGVAVALEAMQGGRPPWQWQDLPGLTTLLTRGSVVVTTDMLVLLSVGLGWELAYACTWLAVRERRVWLALGLLVGTLVLTGHARGHDPEFAALTALGLSMALVAAVREQRLGMPRLVASRLSLRAPALVLLVVVCSGMVAGAWAAPTPSSGAIGHMRAGNWPALLRSVLTRIGLTTTVVGDPVTELTTPGSDVDVGGEFHPDPTPLFEARVADPTRSPYWRGGVYDRYEGGVWHVLPLRRVRVALNARLPVPTGVGAVTPIRETVTMLRPMPVIVTAGFPLHVGVATTAGLARGGIAAGVLSLAPSASKSSAGSGDAARLTYHAVSLPAPTGPVAPAPRLDRSLRALDLALPALPERVHALASLLTADVGGPYEQAWAIQRYLRDGTGPNPYQYDLSPPQAPADQDPTDFFLFSSRHGFCTHFATAMVVLAREVGIPARLVTGYAAGHLDHGRLVVRAADAHAWPELWIVGRGWITFEPTPSFPTPWQISGVPAGPSPVVHPGSPLTATPVPTTPPAATATRAASSPAGATPSARRASATPLAPASTTAVAGPGQGSSTSGGGSGAGGTAFPGASTAALAASALAASTVLVVALLTLLLRLRAPDATDLYRRMALLARWLGSGPRHGQTPLEWATHLASRAPDDRADILALTLLYLRQRYSRRPADPGDLALARLRWRALRGRWLRRLVTRRRLAK